jgi:predicted dehydrogenase
MTQQQLQCCQDQEEKNTIFKFKLFMNKLYSLVLMAACIPFISNAQVAKPFTIATLDPGHFHAALVQKTMYPNVSKDVYVYAKPSADLDMHLKRISDYNNRKDNPTAWNEVLYTGDDFFDKMIADKKGNIVMLSGNNEKKSEYILNSLQKGFHVLADKPMAIDEKGFEKIKKSFAVAKQNKLQLYDIMTERFEVTTVLQRLFSQMPEIFGKLENGTKEHPAIEKKNVHLLYKMVSGNVLTRPEWFMDINKQGEGIADVMTHMTDLVQWEAYPDQVLDYHKDIQILDANHWPTMLSLKQFNTLTHATQFPDYLAKNVVHDTLLKYYCNGDILYKLKNTYVKTTTLWNYASEDGSGDTYEAFMKGTKSTLIVKQGKAENFKPILYIAPKKDDAQFEQNIQAAVKKLQTSYEGLTATKTKEGWRIDVPAKYREGHEEHFARVVQHYLGYLQNNNMPAWEVPNMLAKYYTTTKALTLAQSKK